MDGKKIGEEIEAAWEASPHTVGINSGGNLGMVFLAAALHEVAGALREVADAWKLSEGWDPEHDPGPGPTSHPHVTCVSCGESIHPDHLQYLIPAPLSSDSGDHVVSNDIVCARCYHLDNAKGDTDET